MKDLQEPVDADSGRTPSDDEKRVGVDNTYGELPPDPDAGLSDDERARIVSRSRSRGLGTRTMCGWSLTNPIGPQTPLETRPEAHPVAVSAIPLLVP